MKPNRRKFLKAGLGLAAAGACLTGMSPAPTDQALGSLPSDGPLSIVSKINPITRYVHVSYKVPADSPSETIVRCEVRQSNSEVWRPASVWPYMSETALNLVQKQEWENGILRGSVVERRAAGLRRTVVWNPFRLVTGIASVDFRITLLDGERAIAQDTMPISLDNSDVVILHDWSKVMQRQLVSENPQPGSAVWWLKTGQAGDYAPTEGTSLEVKEKGIELPQLTYPLDLKGYYAIFVVLPAKLGCIELRLSGDERSQMFSGESVGNGCYLEINSLPAFVRAGHESFWRWADMTRQHLVIEQPYKTVSLYEESFRAHLDSVRLVPLTPELVAQLNKTWSAEGQKRTVIGYYEPGSWAFQEKVESNLDHWKPLLAFAEARFSVVDINLGRGGSVLNYESRVDSQLLGAVHGDPSHGKVPHSSAAALMQEYTNTFATELKYARQLGMKPAANFGATSCYVGSDLESNFSKEHPEWRSGDELRYDVPEVRRFMSALFEEALQIGAERLSLDWCRYPETLKSKGPVTEFMRELRRLADRYGNLRGVHIDILARFPARGVPSWQYMDYRTWVREQLVDFLCPSNIQGRHLNFDLSEYLAATKGTKTRLLPNVTAHIWGLSMPGMFWERVLKCYEEGCEGAYVYQADCPTLGSPEGIRYLSLCCSEAALKRWRAREQAEQGKYSKNIYLSLPPRGGQYQPWGRLRVWIEGFSPGLVELFVDDKKINRYTAPPYVLTSEERSEDKAIQPGKRILTVRAEDGSGWLEKEFKVYFGSSN
ncbi:MAG TPA: hypothetical protein VFL79_10995 [Terriglobia bacterium]|nr:hypothetical protein [Terriglobia bacterium]